MNTEYFESVEVSDVGRKRKNNEDACLRIPERGVFCVADGMGGQAGGDLASEAITTTLQQVFSKATPEEDATFARRITLFRKATNQASKWIKNFADDKVLGQMGSTVVALVIDPRNPHRAAALHAGDSRLYRFRRGEFKQITTDHSAVEALAAKLGITPDKIPAKYQNELLRAVGLTEAVELEKTPVEIISGDLYLICSDGLSKMLSDEQIAKFLKDGAKDSIANVAQKLINAANEAGGKDNVTVVLVKAGDLASAPNVIDPNEEEEDQTLVAPVQPPAEPPTPANYPGQTPMPDSSDVQGDTPHTPTPITQRETPKPEKDTADKPPAPVPTPVSTPPVAAATPTAAPTSVPAQKPVPAPVPTPKAATEIPSAKKETKTEKPTSEKTTKPETKIVPSKIVTEPEKKKSSPVGVVVVVAIIILAAGAGIWFTIVSKSKTPAPSAEIPAKPAVTNSPEVAAVTTPAKPPAAPPATNAAPDQTQAAMLEAGRTALKNAQAAFDNRDYKSAAALAATALQKIPGDAAATKLQADALAQLKTQDAWRDALTQAQAAFTGKDYKNAVAWADEALKNIPNEQTALKLRDSAQQQLAAAEAAQEQVQKYQAALSEAREAFKTNNFTLANTKAREALAIRPNDPAAEQIIQQMQMAMDLDDARRFFRQGDYDTVVQICQSHPNVADFKQLAASCQAEQKALADAKKLFNAGDYSFVAQIQKQAYAGKPPFAELLKQAAAEQKLLAELSSLKQAGDWNSVNARFTSPAFSTVTNKASFRAIGDWAQAASAQAQAASDQAQKQKLLQQAAVSFEDLLVWFNIKDPTDPYIQTAEAKKQTRRDGTLTVESRKNAQDTVAWLEDFYGKMGMLEQNDRAKLLKQLKDAIASHN